MVEKVTQQAKETAKSRGSRFCFDASDFSCWLGEWRDKLKSYVEFSHPGDIFVVNVAGFGEEHFALLLKSLESLTVGEFWLYGRLLASYPLTVRSRCQVTLDQEEGEVDMVGLQLVLDEVKAMKKLDSASKDVPRAEFFVPYLYNLGHYDTSMAVAMVLLKASFVDFLYMLDVSNLSSFSALMSFAERLKDENAVLNLYEEWLAENPIFSEKELRICPAIHDPKIKADLDNKLVLGKFFVPYLICAKMVKSK